jgi:hypothetical protein
MPCHTENSRTLSTPTGSRAACMNLQDEQVSIMHHMHPPNPLSRKIIQHNPWADWAPTTKLKNINSELWSNTNSRGGGGMLNLPQRMKVGQEAKLSVPNSQWMNASKAMKAESRTGATSQPPKSGQVWIPELTSWDRGQHSKLSSPTLLGEELTKHSCSCRAAQLLPGENNSSDHPAQTGRITSSPNYC